jgi:hypothetical protein
VKWLCGLFFSFVSKCAQEFHRSMFLNDSMKVI